MILDRGCFERGCACYDERVDKDGIEVIKKEWVGLTDEEIKEISFNLPIKWTGHLQGTSSIYDFARAIEAKLKEKNT